MPAPGLPVAIVGGGFIGLTLGLALARHGIRVELLERTPFETQHLPEFDGRTLAVSYGSRRILEVLGAWPAIAPEAEAILDVHVSDRLSPVFVHYDHAELGDEPLGYIVENRHIRRALHEAARNCPNLRIHAPASLTGWEADSAGVSLHLASGQALRASLLVAADGRHSFIRDKAGIRAQVLDYGQTAIVATISHALHHGGLAHERFLPAGPFAVLPMTGNRSSLVWTESNAMAPHYLGLDEARFTEAIRERLGGYLGDITPVGPRFSHPLTLLQADSYTGDRVALVGDAAHAIHPIAGQGANLGFRDVAALAEILVNAAREGQDLGSPQLLQAFEGWRSVDTVSMLAVTDGLNRLFSNRSRLLYAARNIGFAAVQRMAPVKRFLMKHAMGQVGDLPKLMRGESL